MSADGEILFLFDRSSERDRAIARKTFVGTGVVVLAAWLLVVLQPTYEFAGAQLDAAVVVVGLVGGVGLLIPFVFAALDLARRGPRVVLWSERLEVSCWPHAPRVITRSSVVERGKARPAGFWASVWPALSRPRLGVPLHLTDGSIIVVPAIGEWWGIVLTPQIVDDWLAGRPLDRWRLGRREA